ncbi:hypothetical protein [Xanthomonas albilineans]|uniref:hypothetical protein n=1 Tax=Xanthomonas albilineans TaxID=29447 RepID=UPI0011AFE0A1|nr:hypothetical protein [Xanthomonas albilineans]
MNPMLNGCLGLLIQLMAQLLQLKHADALSGETMLGFSETTDYLRCFSCQITATKWFTAVFLAS